MGRAVAVRGPFHQLYRGHITAIEHDYDSCHILYETGDEEELEYRDCHRACMLYVSIYGDPV